MNALKDSIKSGRTVVGTTATPNVDVSILAEAGYDFLLFDTQHSAWEIKQLQPSIQAMRGKQAAPLVRVAGNLNTLSASADCRSRQRTAPPRAPRHGSPTYSKRERSSAKTSGKNGSNRPRKEWS